MKVKIVLAMLLLSCSAASGAVTYKERQYFGEVFSLEQYFWREYDDQEATVRKEQGQRVAVGLTTANTNWNHPGVIYEAHITSMLGVVYYDDSAPMSHVSSASTLSSKADYAGGSAQLMTGQRFGFLVDNHMLEIMGGVDVSGWLKNIRNGNGNTDFGEGVREVYGVVNGRAAIGVSSWTRRIRQRLQIGIRYPLYSRFAYISGRKLVEPGMHYSLFGSLEISNIAVFRKRHVNLRFYSDYMNMETTSQSGTVYRDQSKKLNVGVSLIFHN